MRSPSAFYRWIVVIVLCSLLWPAGLAVAAPVPQETVEGASADVAISGLYRTRITVRGPADWARLERGSRGARERRSRGARGHGSEGAEENSPQLPSTLAPPLRKPPSTPAQTGGAGAAALRAAGQR
jgi:hypothetical protein